ncbi:MAG: hypothetical protein ACFB0C_15890 [Leptolyngbyaceae cyanobacterium]
MSIENNEKTSFEDNISEKINRNRKFDIFISYRTNPDQSLAVALRNLLESGIDPSPNVFVAGAGGLRPSHIGYKPQIQQAAQTAKSFIAIITQQSKEREWLFYEAGAAWGRNQLFAPLLIGTNPTELASTMADYQTVRASIKEEVERLLEAISEALGGKVKSRFSQRYKTFIKAIEQRQIPDNDENEESDDSPSEKAVELIRNGEIEEGNNLFEALIEKAEDKDKKFDLIIHQMIVNQKDARSILVELEDLEPEFREVYRFQFWMGLLEARANESIAHYEECLRLTSKIKRSESGYFRRESVVEIAQKKIEIGEKTSAFEDFKKAVSNEDRDLRVRAIEAWFDLDLGYSSLEKLVLLSFGLRNQPESLKILRALRGYLESINQHSFREKAS